jgi:tetratricopeptide (TPR) repeat protein
MSPASSNSGRSRGLDYSAPRIDQVLEGLILALLLYLPLAFGGVMPQSRIVLIAMGSLIAAIFAVRCITEPEATITTSWAFVPAAGFMAVAVLQLVSLPIGLLEMISPGSAAAWQSAAEAAGTKATSATVSVYPHGTRTDIVLVTCAFIVMLVGATVYRRRGAFRRLLSGIALIGLLVALIGMVQSLLGADKIYWTFEGPGSPKAGPFASYSHYSEFINIAIGCAIGALLIRAANRGPNRQIELQGLLQWNGASLQERVLTAFLPLGAVAVVLSTSRNGLISLVVAAAIMGGLMQLSRKVEGIGWPMVGMGFVAFAGLLALGVDPIIDRFQSTLEAPSDSMSMRLELIRDTASMALAFPALGSGVGTYELAFPAFDTAMRGGTAQHAENQYLEVFAETGIFGMLFGLSFLGLTITVIWRQLKRTASRTDLALFGVLFSMAAIAFHSLSDFGLEIPAVGMAIATLVGAALGRCSTSIHQSIRARVIATTLAIGTTALLVKSLPAAFQAEEAYTNALLAEDLRQQLGRSGGVGTKEQHHRLIEQTAAAAAADPTNADYLFWATLANWNGAIAEARGHSADAPLVNPVANPELSAPARVAVEGLLQTLQHGPTHGPAWSVAGQLKRVWLDSEEPQREAPDATLAGEWILRGRSLAPHHPSTCLAAAFELMRRGEEAEAIEELNRAVVVGASKHGVVDLLAGDLAKPNLALPLVEGNLGLTERLLNHVRKAKADDGLLAELTETHENLLVAACARSTARPHELARLAVIKERRGETEGALNLYRRLLSVDPYSKQRYEYAKLLVAEGDKRSARRELRDVIQFHPKHTAAENLLQSLERNDIQ